MEKGSRKSQPRDPARKLFNEQERKMPDPAGPKAYRI
jgi:hypothetical protein